MLLIHTARSQKFSFLKISINAFQIIVHSILFCLNLFRLICIPTEGLLNVSLAEMLRQDRCRILGVWRVRMNRGKLQHNCLFREL